MTELLVSVRSRDECVTALQTAVGVIDVKEPARGSLGAADMSVIREVVALVAGRRRVSVALGELRDFDLPRQAGLPAVDYLKLGLAGCADWPAWRTAWHAAWQRLPRGSRRVAVAYADATVARAPHWTEVLEAGRACGCSVLLLDTYDKSAGGLLDWLDRAELEQLRQATRQAAMRVALAGSLTRRQVTLLLELAPDFVAVRGAVCAGGRNARLSATCIEQLLADLAPRAAQ
jgi:uncharacterized protein (UPF0264 family)